MDRSNGLMHIPFDVVFGFSKSSQWVLSDARDEHGPLRTHVFVCKVNKGV